MYIATHNSGTGEKSRRWYHRLLIPFARCQSKTIEELFKNGCRYFDLRARKINGAYHICHGIWESKLTLNEILCEISDLCHQENTFAYVIITYEGECKNKDEFLNDIMKLRLVYSKYILFCSVNVKKPTWSTLWWTTEEPKTKQGFKSLDGTSWHTYIPLPWLWKKIYFNKPQFNNEYYLLVDFL